MRCTGGGAPIKSRAMDFTALVALNFFFLRFGTGLIYLAAAAGTSKDCFASSNSDSEYGGLAIPLSVMMAPT